MSLLRERGIYLAPNGQSFVASKLRQTTSDGRMILSRFGSELSCFLFSRYQWAFHGPPDFELAASGNLLSLSLNADWEGGRLIDTGTTAGAH
jgi:hypothetical protein